MAPHAIVPDLHAFNFPAGKQTVNSSGSLLLAEAFFKIKTMTACLTQYRNNNKLIAPTDRRARCVSNEMQVQYS